MMKIKMALEDLSFKGCSWSWKQKKLSTCKWNEGWLAGLGSCLMKFMGFAIKPN